MKDLMKTNCFDVNETMIIVGSCLERMQPKAYDALMSISTNIYEVCLETIHLNIVITKLIGMLSRGNIKKLIFATVDKSPHCIQLHYIENEVKKAMDLKNVKMIHYVAINNELIEISNNTIKKSRTLSELEEMAKEEVK